jgi:hypothetical protein
LLIDEALGSWDHAALRRRVVDAPAADVYAAIRELDLRRSMTIRLLFSLRGMQTRSLRLFDLVGRGFIVLGERPGEELLLGLVARPWTLRGGIREIQPREFRSFAEEGYARIAWNFRVEPLDERRSCLSTETRIVCTDARSRRRFSRYWAVVAPFSGWTRREMLRLIAEDSTSGGA